MRNQAPIFVNGFQRGGTNILVNLLSSHHRVAWVGETHMVFYGSDWDTQLQKWSDRALYAPILATARQHIFWINKMDDRRPLPRLLWSYIDWLMFRKASSSIDMNDPSKRNGHRPRPLFKNVNAMTLHTGLFSQMYPDAAFIGLVRNGLALCEGFIRRGWTAERFGEMYRRVVEQMIQDASVHPNYTIVRFEDLLANPEKLIPQLYACLDLEFQLGQKYRLQAKPSMDKDGQRRYMFGGEKDRETHWFGMGELRSRLRPDVNENQIARLSPADRKTCLSYISGVMDHFGYME